MDIVYRIIGNMFVIAGVVLYVQAWFDVVNENYLWALVNGGIMFSLIIMASHNYERARR